jgi:hypothetical protein
MKKEDIDYIIELLLEIRDELRELKDPDLDSRLDGVYDDDD